MDAKLMNQTEALALEIATQASTLEDLNTVMKTLMSSALERMLNTELDMHLGRRGLPTIDPAICSQTSDSPPEPQTKPGRNRRNGTSPKTLQGDLGKLPLEIPRDRNGTFDSVALPHSASRLPLRSAASFASPSINGVCRASMKRFWRCTPRG